MRFSRIFILITLVSGFTSCASTRVNVISNLPNGVSIDTLFQASSMIGPVFLPIFPLIDAGVFNEKVFKISNEIMDIEQRQMANFDSILIASIENVVPVKKVNSQKKSIVKDGEGERVVQLQIDNKDFPIVYISKNSTNLVEFGKGRNLQMMFRESELLKKNIIKFASENNSSPIMLVYNRLAVVGVGYFGLTGNMRLETYVFIYDSYGRLIVEANGFTKPKLISGKDVGEIEGVLDEYEDLAELFSIELNKLVRN
jgi:hypothetical protein